MSEFEINYTAYCDGSSRKDGRGGWGYVVYAGHTELKQACGGEYETTNNRMELTAAIRALQSLPVGSRVRVYSDSNYVIQGITEHIDAWLQTGWRTSGNAPLKNRDLWEVLGNLDCDFEVDWRWVKGHSSVPGNERADRLAALGVPENPKPLLLRGQHGEVQQPVPTVPVLIRRRTEERKSSNTRRKTLDSAQSQRKTVEGTSATCLPPRKNVVRALRNR